MDFETHRPRLRAVAYRMLGSLTEADDAVQETWLRASRADTGDVANVAGWLTTITARVCLDQLRRRAARPEEPLPDPVVTAPDGLDPEHEVLLADAVGLALLVVLDTLTPAERLAFVLHDTLGVPFDDIGRLVGRSPNAAAQLASRARRRIRDAAVQPDADLTRQWKVADAFLAAARAGDFTALVEVLAPDVVLRADAGTPVALRGADDVAPQVLSYARMAPFARRVLVNGAVGFVPAPGGQPFAVIALTVRGDRVTAIHILADPDRLAGLSLPSSLP
ncbi:DNA-directed RNA polymerase sigma-70 factor [Virgisporangium ochraceum]|uniref:DNA-directed RNA polymerase sigma-70 factor n=1 Tax=Virgisporangium ochraceum TaxID=65505 RepID=A0A8J3ZMV9_9ACTN|nr:DNA-directed RNA polymerase sigma-70 factor [Virgisporangium ochraceum]